jgi:hypothetical protein
VVKNWHMFFCVAAGLWGGLVIGLVTEYYTSNRYTPVQVRGCARAGWSCAGCVSRLAGWRGGVRLSGAVQASWVAGLGWQVARL